MLHDILKARKDKTYKNLNTKSLQEHSDYGMDLPSGCRLKKKTVFIGTVVI